MSESIYERIDTCTVCGKNEIGLGPRNPSKRNEFRTYSCKHDDDILEKCPSCSAELYFGACSDCGEIYEPSP